MLRKIWADTVSMHIIVSVRIGTVKISHVSSILNAKPFSHVPEAYQTIGTEIKPAMAMTPSRSLDKSEVMLPAEAPRTFRMLISRNLFSVLKAVTPSNPRHAMMIAKTPKEAKISPKF